MKLEEFKAGSYCRQYEYKSFLPEKIDHDWTWDDPRINVLSDDPTFKKWTLSFRINWTIFKCIDHFF